MLKIKGIFFDRKVNTIRDDTAITTRMPVISWQCIAGDGLCQTGFEIRFYDGDNEIYSVFRQSDYQTFEYGGAPLPFDKYLTVRLTVHTNGGQTDMAEKTFICADGLTAPWICAAKDKPNAPVIFSTPVKIEKAVDRAFLYCCGIGYHMAYIDGARAGLTKFSPDFSDYTKTCYYNVSDVTSMMKKGSRDIEIEVADGWRRLSSDFVTRNLGGRKIEFDGVPCLSAELRIYYSDGSADMISTGDDWYYRYNRYITYSNVYNGEHVDMTRPPQKKRRARLYDGEPLGERRLSLLQENSFESFHCESCFKVNGSYVFDFGQNIAGYIIMELPRLSPGDKVTFLYGEMLNEDGTVYTAPLREAQCTDIYISNGAENEFISPFFTFHGFRYVEVKGLPYANKDDITAWAHFTDLQTYASGFECGSPLVNRLHCNTYMTERSNMMSILSDCPQRDERMGWLNDATVRFEETPYNFDIGAMYPKIVRDILDAQRPTGEIGCTAPFIFGQLPADPVCSSFLVAADLAYMFTGNTDVISEGFDGFEKWERVLLDRSDGYIVNYSYYGDWAAPSYACLSEEFACSAVTPGILMSTGYSYYNCRLLQKFSGILGYTEKEKYYSELSDKIADAFCKKWFDEKTGVIECGSMGAYAFALWLGILPEQCRAKAAKHMRDDLTARDFMFTTGNLTTKYLFDMLAEYGYIQEAWRLLTRTDYPSIGYEIDHGATTVWERFELKKNPDMNSHNHPMYGACDYFLHAYLAGVKITAPGCRRISVKPYLPEKLHYCRDIISTMLGDIEVKWTVEFGKKNLYLSIPFGMTADVDFCGVRKTVKAGSHRISLPV